MSEAKEFPWIPRDYWFAAGVEDAWSLARSTHIRAFGGLMRLIGNEVIVDLRDNAGLEELIFKLSEKTSTTRKGYIGSYEAGSDLIVLVNGRNMNAKRAVFLE